MRVRHHIKWLLCYTQTVLAARNASTNFWYSTSAVDFNAALPIGNGRLGAMVYGRTDKEILTLNEDSIWSGGFVDRINPKAVETLPQVSESLIDGNLSRANSLWESGMASSERQRIYQPMCTLELDFGHNETSSYNRTLDLKTGIAEVQYVSQGTRFSRQAVASFPHGVLAFRLSSATPKSISFNMSLSRSQNVTSVSVDSNRAVTLRGTSSADKSISFATQARLVTKGGTVTSTEDKTLVIKDADEAWIYVDGETSWRYPLGPAEYEAALKRTIDQAVSLGWDKILECAVEDYQGLASRVSLDLGGSGIPGTAATDQRIKAWRAGANFTADPELLTLMFNYGRYLLISSSREGSLPANLQGIWNNDFAPMWDSKFTMNINLEMNYWASETGNLPETVQPLFDHIQRMQARGQTVAKEMYNMSGWVCHHNSDIWADCAPLDSRTYWGAWPMSGPWLMLHLYEHYRFQRKDEFATGFALPIVEDLMDFYYEFSRLEDGKYVTLYGSSPENRYVIPNGKATAGSTSGLDVGPAMDRQLLHELFSGYLELKKTTGQTEGLSKAKDYLSRIRGPDISRAGHLLEWSEDLGEVEPGHRHLSHLFGIFPGGHIHPLINRTVSDAAATSLRRRMDNGSGQTGWSAAWAVALYARLLDGDSAVYRAGTLIDRSVFDNLFGKTSIFQIDANLGVPGGIIEVLLQSHTGTVHIGAALPKTLIPDGEVRGLRARGGFLVDLAWKSHKITTASVRSTQGGSLSLRVQEGVAFSVDGKKYVGPIKTIAGKEYSIRVY